MPSGAVLQMHTLNVTVRLLLSAFWPTGYVAPVEQCCLCPVGLIRYVACAAVLLMPSGGSLQIHILNVTVCRAAFACSENNIVVVKSGFRIGCRPDSNPPQN